MSKVNIKKTERGALVAKMWQTVKYQSGTTNCGNCENASKSWRDEHGECRLVPPLKFPVLSRGICRMHSAFKMV